jgi:Tol biopolymer transport system component
MLKTSLKIGQSQTDRRIWGIPLIMCIFLLLNSCDTCNTSGLNGGNSDEKIYYTAISANNSIPDIYSINKNGTGIKKLISNGVAFSSPSTNRQICYLRKGSEGSGELYLFDSDKVTEQLIAKENNLFEIAFPVLSSDGAKIAFNAGSGKLLSYKNIANPIFNQITGKLLSGSIPSFSPDSKKLAYFESLTAQSVTVKIIDAVNTDVITTLFTKELNGAIMSEVGNVSINWSQDSKSIIFSVQNDSISILYIYNIETGDEQNFSFDDPNIIFNQPAISHDSKFAVFANKDNNLWIMNLTGTDRLFSQITKNGSGAICFNPQWSNDGISICYNMASDFSNGVYSNLMLAEVAFDGNSVRPKLIMILSNNVYKGFWR